MSYAVFDLDIESPPISVRRVRVGSETRWVAICEVCQHRSARRPLLSVAVKDQQRHGASHAPTMLRAATERGASIHRLGMVGGQWRVPAPLDAVHLSEPQRKAS